MYKRQVLDPTLTKAKTVLANENALEKDVNDAYDGLVKAFLQLQMKTSNDLLNEYIAKAEKLDQKAYTNTSWKTFEAALTPVSYTHLIRKFLRIIHLIGNTDW